MVAIMKPKLQAANEAADEIVRLGLLIYKDAVELTDLSTRWEKADMCRALRRAAERLTSVANSAEEYAAAHGFRINHLKETQL